MRMFDPRDFEDIQNTRLDALALIGAYARGEYAVVAEALRGYTNPMETAYLCLALIAHGGNILRVAERYGVDSAELFSRVVAQIRETAAPAE